MVPLGHHEAPKSFKLGQEAARDYRRGSSWHKSRQTAGPDLKPHTLSIELRARDADSTTVSLIPGVLPMAAGALLGAGAVREQYDLSSA